MVTLVTGGSGSGKSEFAESLVTKTRDPNPYYLATMQPWDQECRRRIGRHREMRREKNFVTIETYGFLKDLSFPQKPGIILLECLSNYVSNLWYGAERGEEEGVVLRHLEEDLAALAGKTHDLVIVTNEVFSDGMFYSLEVQSYLRILGELNVRLAAKAHRVAEVVYGIPIWVKGED